MADSPSRTSTAVSRGAPVERQGSAARTAAAKLASVQRRERLRDFQTGLADKLRRAQGAPLAVNRLGIQIGVDRLLIDLADAGEILAVPDIMPVPLTKPWYRGLANVRGNLLGIVDLSLFAGGPATPLDKESRVLAFSTDLHFSAGLLVSRMLGLRSAADLSAVASEVERPESGSLYAAWVRSRLVDAQHGQWQELDLGALAADARFLDIARVDATRA